MELDPSGIAARAGVLKGMVVVSANEQSVVPDDSQASMDACMEAIGEALEALQAHLVFKRRVRRSSFGLFIVKEKKPVPFFFNYVEAD